MLEGDEALLRVSGRKEFLWVLVEKGEGFGRVFRSEVAGLMNARILPA